MRIPQLVEPRKLSQKAGFFDGELLAEDMPRVLDAIDSCESLNVTLQFDRDEEHRRVLTGSIKGPVNLECQRCLKPVEHPLDIEIHLAMVWDEDQAKQLPSHIEPWIVGEDPEDLHAILEEEILLGLPVVAFHEENCIDPSTLSVGDVEPDTEEKENPFLVLAQLKNNKRKK